MRAEDRAACGVLVVAKRSYKAAGRGTESSSEVGKSGYSSGGLVGLFFLCDVVM